MEEKGKEEEEEEEEGRRLKWIRKVFVFARRTLYFLLQFYSNSLYCN